MGEKLILASASAARQEMLKRAGVPHSVAPARIDEAAIKEALLADSAPPRDIADALAEQKARRVSARHPGALVLAADQVLEHGGDILSKPGDTEAARTQLRRLRGDRHRLYSAAVICRDTRPVWRHVEMAELRMHRFSDGFLERYLNEAGPGILGCVGCYQIEGAGIRLFSELKGDYFTILGLPLTPILNHLYQTGFLDR